MSWPFTPGGQSIRASSSASVFPMNIQGWFPLWLTGLIAIQGTLKSLLQQHSSKASIFLHSGFFIVQLSHPYMTTGKTIGLTRWTFVDKVMSLLFNMLSRLVITFLRTHQLMMLSSFVSLQILSFLSSLKGLLRQPFYLFAFFSLGDIFEHSLFYNVMNLCS